MGTIEAQIRSVDAAICSNIEALHGQRGLLSQNLLAQLRNLIEAVAVRFHLQVGDEEFAYEKVRPAIAFVKTRGQLNFLGRFHQLIQTSASHYTLDDDASERLMLKYYEYLVRIRSLLRTECDIEILANLELFPVDLDPSLREYHQKIRDRISAVRLAGAVEGNRARYYIHSVKPFFVDDGIYYEVTFATATDTSNKFDRVIAFTDIDMTDKYAAQLTLVHEEIDIFDRSMPITVVLNWEVSIRPCELNNFSRIFGTISTVQSSHSEYQYLMGHLTRTRSSILDLVQLPESEYEVLRGSATAKSRKPQIFAVLDRVREMAQSRAPGRNVIQYLLLRMNNQHIKNQYSLDKCVKLSRLNLQYGCIPFDEMPFCTSLIGHNPRFRDLLESIDAEERLHELLARRVKNNVERRGRLYTDVRELDGFDPLSRNILRYNARLYHKHVRRELVQDRAQVFMREYEEDTVAIIWELQARASEGIANYEEFVERWFNDHRPEIDDEAKAFALRRMFSLSRVALVYGAAGTGKSTMVDHVAHLFEQSSKLFLAHTNPAIDNLRRRVSADNSTFRTIHSHVSRGGRDPEYDLLVIDECSTVSNADLIKVLKCTRFKRLLLVGDVYQIESIQFGNWFGIVRSFIPASSVFELKNPYRTKSERLLSFWAKVRGIESDIAETLARSGYSSVLGESLFIPKSDDEIILCLNYDGIYGINNVNKFLQSGNSGLSATWGASTYKVGDPVLFGENERFRPVIYNNLKGRIVGLERFPDRMEFDVEVERSIDREEVVSMDLELLSPSTVRFSVFERGSGDEDDEGPSTIVPFQVAYAVSIHKAQGLEYGSVKVVITDANEEDVTHSLFYTAVTRAREHLQIFWTPEAQQAVLSRLELKTNSRDVQILSNRHGLQPWW